MPPRSSPRRAATAAARLVALAGGVALGSSVAQGTVSGGDLAGLAVALSAASGLHVAAEDIRWEPSGGLVSDVIVGRSALFLGAAREGAPRDVVRARVRITPEGRPLHVRAAYNLTSTPLGDDHSLVVSGERAAFATHAFGQEQSVTVLDLRGEGAQSTATRAVEKLTSALTNAQQTGSLAGIGRVDITIDEPTRRAGLLIDSRAVTLQLEGARGVTSRTFDLARDELMDASPGLTAQAARHLPKPLVFWAVDTVRAVPWIGPAPIAWLEAQVFALRDEAKKLEFRAKSGGAELATTEPVVLLDGAVAAADADAWPPPKVPSIWKQPEPMEGEWVVPTSSALQKLAPADGGEAPPSPFYTTFVRPDPERPYTKVLFVAMDMRQLDLGMEAGVEDPKPLSGPPGTGRIPRDPAIVSRVVAAFNGGFKTEHGSYGMMVERRVLLPPAPAAATVAVLEDGRTAMGSWGNTTKVEGIGGVASEEIVSFRQNLDPLVDQERVNPSGRAQWGFTLPGTSVQTERSGLCVTPSGSMYYAWGDDLSATMLGKAMKLAGCEYGMHLDMNPHHTGFVFQRIDEIKGRKYQGDLLTTQMGISPTRFIEYSPKDFFYVMQRRTAPEPIGGASGWMVDSGTQPAPGFIPAVWRTSVGGAEVLAIAAGRASFRLRGGQDEPDLRAGAKPLTELEGEDAGRVVLSLSLGTSTVDRPRGLTTRGRVALPLSPSSSAAVLLVDGDGRLSLEPSTTAAGPNADAAELPWLVRGGKVEATVTRGAAIGIAEDGRVVIVRATADVESLGELLVRAGATRAALLDRGGELGGAILRSGTATPPRGRNRATTLYALGARMAKRAFRFDADDPVPPPKK